MSVTLAPQSKQQHPMGEVVDTPALRLLSRLEGESVDCLVTDPPYGIAYHSNRTKDKNPNAPIAGDWDFQVGSFLRQAERVLKPGGALYLFTRFDVLPLWTPEIPVGLALKNVIVWDKKNHSSGDLTGNFGFRHEFIMFLVKGRHKLQGYRYSNVWDVSKVPQKYLRNAAEKPVELYERAISSSSPEGGLIVDPYCGSGTAAEAAIKLNRRFIVSDIDQKMVNVTRQRIGLAPATLDTPPVVVHSCPVLNVVPPDPSLWGVHPEDIAQWLHIGEQAVAR